MNTILVFVYGGKSLFCCRVVIKTQRSRLCEGSSEPSSCQHVCQLEHRALVEVTGEEGRSFLQGFVTADMEREGHEAFYSMMLNAQVRVRNRNELSAKFLPE